MSYFVKNLFYAPRHPKQPPGQPKAPHSGPRAAQRDPKLGPRRGKEGRKTPKGEQQITKLYTHTRNIRKLPIHRHTAAG